MEIKATLIREAGSKANLVNTIRAFTVNEIFFTNIPYNQSRVLYALNFDA